MSRIFLLVFIGLLIVIAIIYVYPRLVFSGAFDKKYAADELTENFINHEREFSDLVSFFKSKVKHVKDSTVAFGIGKSGKVSLLITPLIVDSSYKRVGGTDLELGSPTLDSALSVLKWRNETLRDLREKLAKTQCDWVRTTKIYGEPLDIYPAQSGWGSYTFLVFDRALSERLLKIHGRSITSTEFGKRVILNYSTAL